MFCSDSSRDEAKAGVARSDDSKIVNLMVIDESREKKEKNNEQLKDDFVTD